MVSTLRAAAAGLVLVAGALAGCTTVPPWEHGTLAKPVMSVDDPPQEQQQKLRTYGAKEGGAAATGVGGGGCGCN